MRLDHDPVVERLELLAARGPRARHPARRPRHSARRLRELRAAHAAQHRGVPDLRARRVTRFAPNGDLLGAPILYRNVVDPLAQRRKPTSRNAELDQRFGRRLLLKLAFLHRTGSHEYIVAPDPSTSQIVLSSTGKLALSRDRSHDALPGRRASRPDALVRVGARLADLNTYDYFYGNMRNPILRANEHNLIPTDVRAPDAAARLIGIGGKWDLAPVTGAALGVPVFGRQRVSGLRRPAQSHRAPAVGSRIRLFVVAAVAIQEVPLPRRTARSTTSSAWTRIATSRTT